MSVALSIPDLGALALAELEPRAGLLIDPADVILSAGEGSGRGCLAVSRPPRSFTSFRMTGGEVYYGRIYETGPTVLMNQTELLERAKQRLDSFSPERLRLAGDFLAYLEDRESHGATEELLRIPDLLEQLKEAEEAISAGRLIPVEQLRRSPRRDR